MSMQTNIYIAPPTIVTHRILNICKKATNCTWAETSQDFSGCWLKCCAAFACLVYSYPDKKCLSQVTVVVLEVYM